ncbi:MAG: hypothetical protein Q7S21_04435, partial [archaeon]|nr:hypothetical protein [archaeon]
APESVVDGETFRVEVFDTLSKPITGANTVYGKQFGFTDFVGSISLKAEKGINKIQVSKIGYRLASADIEVLDAQAFNLASILDFSKLDGILKNPISLFILAGMLVGIGLFLLLISQFKNVPSMGDEKE